MTTDNTAGPDAGKRQFFEPIIYNGVVIHERGEMLSLTDMWRAAGGVEAKSPRYWLRQDGPKEFIAYLTATVIQEHSEPVQALNEGGTWNTWAHWQIALAYAKHLSPEFHAACNQIVRAHMEGRAAEINVTQFAISEIQRVASALHGLRQEVAELRRAKDPGVAVVYRESVRQVLDRLGVPPKGRRSLIAIVGHRLRKFTEVSKDERVREDGSRTWMFRHDKVQQWLDAGGLLLIRAWQQERSREPGLGLSLVMNNEPGRPSA